MRTGIILTVETNNGSSTTFKEDYILITNTSDKAIKSCQSHIKKETTGNSKITMNGYDFSKGYNCADGNRLFSLDLSSEGEDMIKRLKKNMHKARSLIMFTLFTADMDTFVQQ